MGGGLLNLISESKLNVFVHGNPNKTFFKKKFTKHTNFGMQTYRINTETNINNLHITKEATISFKIINYGDLMLENYLVLTLPDIWSPIVKINDLSHNDSSLNLYPYEFKWIENIGSQLIKNVKYSVNGKTIQEFTGQYIYCKAEKELNSEKKKLFDEMTGNTKQLNDPANYGGRKNIYPNAVYLNNAQQNTIEPSIRGRKIYVPLNHFTLLSKNKFFPLLLLNNNILNIEIKCRPLFELFVVRHIPTNTYNIKEYEKFVRYFLEPNKNIKMNNFTKLNHLFRSGFFLKNIEKIGKYVFPDQNKEEYEMYRFLKSLDFDYINTIEESVDGLIQLKAHGTITGKINDKKLFNIDNNSKNMEKILKKMDIHLLVKYIYLNNDERNKFINNNNYIFNYIVEKDFLDYQDENIINLSTSGLLYSWMWFFQRSDVKFRNQWSNYTNWETNELPFKGIAGKYSSLDDEDLIKIPSNIYDIICKNISDSYSPADLSLVNISRIIRDQTHFLPYIISGPKRHNNVKDILKSFSIICDGKYRENNLDFGIFKYIEKYFTDNICLKYIYISLAPAHKAFGCVNNILTACSILNGG